MFDQLKPNLKSSLPPAAKYFIIQVGKEDSNGKPPIYLDSNVLLKVFIHSRSSLEKAVTGVLLGEVFVWNKNNYLEIGGTVENRWDQGIGFQEESWVSLKRHLDQEIDQKQILGWYYSNPGEGVILTQEAIFTQRQFFSDPAHFLLVVDPILRKYGVFQWQGGKLGFIPGFKVICLPEKKEQLRQLLHQSGFHYAVEEPDGLKKPNIYSPNFVRAYQPKKIEEIEDEVANEEISFLLTRKDYREIFLSKDVLVNKELRSRSEIQRIIDSLLNELAQVSTKALIRLFWEVRPGEDQYYTDHWICEIRWLGKNSKNSVIWNTELI